MNAVQVLDRLTQVKAEGTGWRARCPAHDDHVSSLSVGEGRDGCVLIHCHAGCALESILDRLDLTPADLFSRKTGQPSMQTNEYDYTDEQGELLYQAVRFHPKTFKFRRPNGAAGDWSWTLGNTRRVIYRLHHLQVTRPPAVFVVEGEKDVATIERLELHATTAAGGAGKWRSEFSQQIVTCGVRGVHVLPDNDDPGRAHAEQVAASCMAAGLEVRVVELPDLPVHGDVTDWIARGHSRTELDTLVRQAPIWMPAASRNATPGPADSSAKPDRYTLEQALTVFRKWLHLNDPTAVYAVAAALVANRAAGDPVWLLLVCAPSTGKTEILSAAMRLPYVVPAAKVTESSLLSGTSKKERNKNATGGVLRQIGAFGVLLIKDFTSVLAQNYDARNEAMAALREVYDGSWHRPVGTDGGMTLSWTGKCGLLGGVTPALDQYGQVLSSLGDRFVLLRMPEVEVEAVGQAALTHGDHEVQMRSELQAALAGLVEHADLTAINRVRSKGHQAELIRLAAYTARARTIVARDAGHNVLYLPQVEGPGRLVKAYARILAGLEAIGCTTDVAWTTLGRIAIDCAPTARTMLVRELLQHDGPRRTSDIATAAGLVTKTVSRQLEDLLLLKMVTRSKASDASNSPDLWAATEWLRKHFPVCDR
jgi:hypothetical protein